MEDKNKTKAQLIRELGELRQRLVTLESSENERKLIEKNQKRGMEIIEMSLHVLPDMFFVFDIEGKFLFWNKRVSEITGYSDEDITKMRPTDFFSPEEGSHIATAIEKVIKEGQTIIEANLSTKDGRQIPYEFKSAVLKETDGKILGISGAGRDITKRNLAIEALKISENKLHTITSALGEGVYVLDKAGRLTFMNPEAERLLGWKESELLGKDMHMMIHQQKEDGTELPNTECHILRSISLGNIYRIPEDKFTRKDGNLFPVAFVSTPIMRDGKIIGSVAAFHDITERKRMEEELRALSLKDELTGLYNRRGLVILSEHLLKTANRLKRGVFLLYADLDNMKVINDTFGHSEGDKVLVEIANILKETYRNSDVIARIGGDEFVIIPVGVAGDNMGVITERLQKSLETHNLKVNRSYNLALSAGIAYYDPENPCSIDELLLQGDKLMYEQKIKKKRLS